MWQFIFGVFVGSIIGIFIMSIVSVAKTDEQETRNKTDNSTEKPTDA